MRQCKKKKKNRTLGWSTVTFLPKAVLCCFIIKWAMHRQVSITDWAENNYWCHMAFPRSRSIHHELTTPPRYHYLGSSRLLPIIASLYRWGQRSHLWGCAPPGFLPMSFHSVAFTVPHFCSYSVPMIVMPLLSLCIWKLELCWDPTLTLQLKSRLINDG